ncbi:sodium:calcium antiporter [Salinarchaeum chitinilyticum]
MLFDRLRHPLWALVAALGLTVPWVLIYLTGSVHAIGVGPRVALSGIAVLGASFLLAWGAETAEKDVPRAFAIAVLAVLAVAPEYAVDALYAWQAGSGEATAKACSGVSKSAMEQGSTELARACHDANLAVANMTGANRILIGLGWSGIALFTVWKAWQGRADPNVRDTERFRDGAVEIDPDLSLEILFLLAATAVAFTVPFMGGIGAIDTLVLVGLYVVYISVVIKGDVEEHGEQVGVPRYLQRKSFPVRSAASLTLFVYSGLMIFTAVEPFAHGLEAIGLQYGIPEFFMIQWIAPLASESPELIVVAYLVNKARSTAAFNALISSKLNQWTLLIGTLAVVYSIALGRYGVLPFDSKQAAEIWITAAQSLFAIAILVNFRISVKESVLLFALFLSQVVIEFGIIRLVAEPEATDYSILLLQIYTVVYLVLSAGMLYRRRDALREIGARATGTIADAYGIGGGADDASS